jgi:hypothetical protein
MTKEEFKSYLKPLTDGLFGKQKPYHLKQERQTIYPVGTIVGDLCQIDDTAWGKYAFSRELLNGKFTNEQRAALTGRALACGAEYARKCIAEYGLRDPKSLAKRLGLEVDYPQMPQNTDRVLFAEFRIPNKVHIYMDGVEKADTLMDEPGVREALTGDLAIARLLLAHELFHFVEERHAKEIWTRTYEIELWALKPLHNRSGVAVLSEIAAMAFAKELTRLPYSPYVMDAFLVYGYSPEAASALYEEMMKYAGREIRPAPEEAISPGAR